MTADNNHLGKYTRVIGNWKDDPGCQNCQLSASASKLRKGELPGITQGLPKRSFDEIQNFADFVKMMA